MAYTGPLTEEEKKWQVHFSRRLEGIEGSGSYCTAFLDPRQLELAEAALAKAPALAHAVYGGHPQAERNIVCITPAAIKPGLPPVKAVLVSWNADKEEVGHRDLLGAIMGLGLRRDQVGDILLMPEGGAAVMASSEKAEYIALNLDVVGRTAVTCRVTEPEDLPLPREDGRLIKGTVASLRADAVISLGFGISRSKMATLIKNGLVRVNWRFINSPSHTLAEGDQLALKGRGRLIVEQVEGETRKGRIRVKLKKYS